MLVVSRDGRFDWDSEKNIKNKENHGFYFEEILDLFNDPFFLESYDEEHSSVDEERWKGIASFNQQIYFYISYSEGERIRIISARLAEPKERLRYNENYQNCMKGYL